MNRLDRAKKSQVQQFRDLTQTTTEIAQQCLSAGEWNIEAAIEYYYSSGITQQQSAQSRADLASQDALLALYNRYKDEHADMILADGMGRFCEDLQVDPADVVMLVIARHFGAATACEFSRDEFTAGMARLRCDTPERLRRRLPELRRELEDDWKFKDMYVFAYAWGLEKGVKCMQQDTAIALWRLLFAAHPWPLLDAWCEFLEAHHNRAVSKDTWMQLLDFSRLVKPDLSNFEDSGSAWPYLLDDFVEYMRAGKQLPAAA